MTDLDAIMIAEGETEATYEEQVEAWRCLYKTGLAYRLQGWYGRTAQRLIQAGVIEE